MKMGNNEVVIVYGRGGDPIKDYEGYFTNIYEAAAYFDVTYQCMQGYLNGRHRNRKLSKAGLDMAIVSKDYLDAHILFWHAYYWGDGLSLPDTKKSLKEFMRGDEER